MRPAPLTVAESAVDAVMGKARRGRPRVHFDIARRDRRGRPDADYYTEVSLKLREPIALGTVALALFTIDESSPFDPEALTADYLVGVIEAHLSEAFKRKTGRTMAQLWAFVDGRRREGCGEVAAIVEFLNGLGEDKPVDLARLGNALGAKAAGAGQ